MCLGEEIHEEIIKEMEEGINREEVTKLLSEMLMWDENGEGVWEGEEEPNQGVHEADMMDMLEILPKEILPSN
jgi:hypothetical protein